MKSEDAGSGYQRIRQPPEFIWLFRRDRFSINTFQGGRGVEHGQARHLHSTDPNPLKEPAHKDHQLPF